MITIISKKEDLAEEYFVSCPFCNEEISFFLSIAFYCQQCKKILPPLHLLIIDDSIISRKTRLEYYEMCHNWLEGDY